MKPFSPRGAREVVVPQLFPAPSGGRMSEGHGVPARTKYERGELKGASSIAFDFYKSLIKKLYHAVAYNLDALSHSELRVREAEYENDTAQTVRVHGFFFRVGVALPLQ